MLPRTLEPEVMDSPDEAADYDDMAFEHVNQQFVTDLLAAWAAGTNAETLSSPFVLDAGTGTGRIPVILGQRLPGCRILATDLSPAMLQLAERNIAKAGLAERIAVERIAAGQLAERRAARFDMVMSNSLIHHVPEPQPVLAALAACVAPGGLLFIRDLFRPDSSEEVERLVREHAGNETATGQQLFRQSFHAALTLDEVRAMARTLPLKDLHVTMTSDRHWTLTGWA